MNPVLVIAAIVGALIGGGGLGGYLSARRTAIAAEKAAATSKPHEMHHAETEAFQVFMDEARASGADLRARLAECERKHAEQEVEIATLRARIAHLEAVTKAAGSTLGSLQPGVGE